VVGCCIVGSRAAQQSLQGSCGEDASTAGLRAAAEAHKLSLHPDCIVYERKEHENDLVRNYVCTDQYGHRYSNIVQQKTRVPPMKLSIPLAQAECVLLPTKALNIVRPFDASGEVEAQLCCCMYPALDGSVVAVRVGEGLKTVVAIVECGPDSNAEAFVQAANRASQAAPAMPPALASAYSAWFMGRLQQTGTMTGCGPRAPGNAEIDRGAAKSSVAFVKHIGPIIGAVDVQKNWVQSNRLKIDGSTWLDVDKHGTLHCPKYASPFADALHAGDTLVSINDVAVSGNVDSAWLDTAKASKAPGTAGYMAVVSTQPYFQPNHLLTVMAPSGGALTQLGLAANAGKPPKIEMPTPMASGMGLLAGDVIVQAIVDGAPLDTTTMDSSQLLAATASVAGPVQLNVLQSTRVGQLSHPVTWPRAEQFR